MYREISLSSRRRTEFLEITREVEKALKDFGLEEGSVLVYVPHTTAGITINENADPSVVGDLAAFLEEKIPWVGPYAHAEGNAAAHVKATLMGSSVTVPVSRGKPCLGTWQGIFLTEFDGPRSRRVIIRAHRS